jgi:hypothetical protein
LANAQQQWQERAGQLEAAASQAGQQAEQVGRELKESLAAQQKREFNIRIRMQ